MTPGPDLGAGSGVPGPRGPGPQLAGARLVAAATAVVGFVAYLANAAALIAYPWDWSPDEGVALDFARRLLLAPATLYPGRAVPVPDGYGPVTWALLAPVVATFDAPIHAARVVALGWTLAATAAAYVLIRRQADAVSALLGAALILVPMQESFRLMVLRPDGLLLALWLWSAVLLLPPRLERGAARLGWQASVLGAGLIVLGVLTKPVMVLLGLPMVVSWLLVDAKSGWRLARLLAGIGLSTLLLVQVLSGGGYLAVVQLWASHPYSLAHLVGLLRDFALGQAPLLLWAVAAAAWAWSRGRPAWRDGAMPLWLGALLVVPTLAKYGSSSVYLLPLLAATAVLGARLLAAGAGTSASGRARALGAVATAMVALWFVAQSRFPLPSREDRVTGDVFYGTLRGLVRERGGPLLAMRPEYAYFHVGQATELEGSSFFFLTAEHASGTADVFQRVAERGYTVVLGSTRFLAKDRALFDSIRSRYVPFAGCHLGFYFGTEPTILLAPKDRPVAFSAVPGARCERLDASALE